VLLSEWVEDTIELLVTEWVVLLDDTLVELLVTDLVVLVVDVVGLPTAEFEVVALVVRVLAIVVMGLVLVVEPLLDVNELVCGFQEKVAVPVAPL
jgi:hypothetical protein